MVVGAPVTESFAKEIGADDYAEDAISAFQETDKILSQQLSIESGYYIALRDYTINLIDYSDVDNIQTKNFGDQTDASQTEHSFR